MRKEQLALKRGSHRHKASALTEQPQSIKNRDALRLKNGDPRIIKAAEQTNEASRSFKESDNRQRQCNIKQSTSTQIRRNTQQLQSQNLPR